ncbi:DUF6359 domain-containing protein [Pseudogracilibacillus sp. SO10305]|uniref:DUF6359 domain-containing protein n=1 Tax=Pseudogracilibacillus sp. SO10305 TaxID=3098292 RepID=UPI00300DFC40
MFHAKAQWKKTFSLLMIFLLLLSNVSFMQSVYAEETVSVEEAIENNEGMATVEGYIVGYVISGNNVTTDIDRFENTNIAIATDANETDIEKMLFVQITKDFRDQFGLASNPNIIGEKIIITGSLETYHTKSGLKNPTAISFADGTVEPEPPLEEGPVKIEEAHKNPTGNITVQGVVTAKLKNTIQIQDETGAIAVRPTNLDVSIGDEVTVQGNLAFYNKLLQLNDALLIEKHGKKDVVAEIVTGGKINDEIESQLITVKNVSLTKDQIGNGWVNYTASDGDGEFIVRDETDSLSLEIGETYDSITGIVIQFNDEFQIVPRSQDDIVANDNQVRPVYATPGAGSVPSGTEVALTTATDEATIYYTVDGTDPTETTGTEYTDPIMLEKDTTIKAIAYKDGFDESNITTFTYNVYDAERGLQIHDIQGPGHTSPYVNHVVEDIEGIVTYTYEIRGANYFHLQAEEDNYDGNKDTSEAIIVYTGRAENIDVGNKVKVTGEVDEYYIDGYDDKNETDLSVTQINARNDRGGMIEVIEDHVDLPTPITITSSDIPNQVIGKEGFNTFDREKNAMDYWESLEGMLVEIPPAKAVAPQEHGDLVVVTEEFETDTIHGGLLLEKDKPNAQFIQYKLYPNNNARNLKVKTGDVFTKDITGVVNYGFQNYKVYADLEDIEVAFEEGETEPKETILKQDRDKLSIAAYNVENFSANTSETSEEKAANIARAIVQDMHAPDIVGLIEMQDNNGMDSGPEDADASETFTRLIQVIEEAGGPTYDYVNINPIYNEDGGAPNSNIRVGFIYNKDRVSLVDGEIGTAEETVEYKNGELTLNPGRVGPNEAAFESSRKPLAAQFEFDGETFVAIANHLNSKRGDEAIFGQIQPPTLKSEPQRMEQAAILNNFMREIQEDNPDENIIVLGDMNDFEFSNPIEELKGDILTNLIDHVPAEKRYTYVFQGNSQVLDHILVSNNLAQHSEVDILHVNADFTPMHGRASDHDPVLAHIDLTKTDVETDEGDEEEQGTNGSGNNEEDDKSDGELSGDGAKEDTEQNDEDSNETYGIKDDIDGEVATNDDDHESELPNTATSMYTYLFIGIILTAAGITIVIIRRVKV